MSNLKGSTFEKQIRNANFRLAKYGEKRYGTNSHLTHSDAVREKRDMYFNDFKNYLEANSITDGKLNEYISENILEDFFEIRLKGLDFSTQEDYIRGFSGLIQGLEQTRVSIPADTLFLSEQVSLYRTIAEENGKTFDKPKYVTTTFHPTEVISELKGSLAVVAQLQYEIGIRVSEAYQVIENLEKHLFDMKLKNIIGKGGQKYQDKIISLELKISLLKLHAQQIKLPVQSTYYKHLQKFDMSSHDFRAFFAKELYEDKISDGLTHKEACLIVSKELNHHRQQITEYYLAKFQ